MTVIGAILTSLVVAREWERGTMEALLSTEVTRVELLLCAYSLLLSRYAGDAALYAGIGVYSRRAVSRFAGDSVYHHQSVFTEYAGDGAVDFHYHCNQFNAAQVALNAAFLPRLCCPDLSSR